MWTSSARFADIVLPATTTSKSYNIERVEPASGVVIVGSWYY
ncbi:MAG: hypothetical protein P4L90_12690 [Rhodopila sp.]|nr:hypothetical protein [Rhodopila sp.]